MNCKANFGLAPNAFFMVIPFVKEIRRWIKHRRRKTSSDSSTPRNKDFHGDQQKNKAQYSAGHTQEEYTHSGGKGKGQGRQARISETSPTPQKYGKGSRQGPVSSPRLNTKQQNVQILKRDGSYSGGSSKKSLTSVFNQEDKNTGKQQRSPRDKFFPHAWRNFTLDKDAIMACFVNR